MKRYPVKIEPDTEVYVAQKSEVDEAKLKATEAVREFNEKNYKLTLMRCGLNIGDIVEFRHTALNIHFVVTAVQSQLASNLPHIQVVKTNGKLSTMKPRTWWEIQYEGFEIVGKFDFKSNKAKFFEKD